MMQLSYAMVKTASDIDAAELRGRGGMVDATDLKSVDRKVVRVRVSPPPLSYSNEQSP